MKKLLLIICFLIPTLVTASYPDGKFITNNVNRLLVLTNAKQDSGHGFVSIFSRHSSVLSLECPGLCYFFSTKTHTPKIDGFDGILWTEEQGARGDGRWIESTGVVSIHTKSTPTFSIPNYPNKFIGIIQNIAGATGHGSFTLYLIDTVTGAVGKKSLKWGKNEWRDGVEFTVRKTC